MLIKSHSSFNGSIHLDPTTPYKLKNWQLSDQPHQPFGTTIRENELAQPMSRKVALTQFLRFATVGAAAVFVDLAIHYTLYYKTTFLATTEMPINRFAALKAISIAVGTMMSYTGNSLWTFREKAKVGIRQFVKYCIVVTSTTSAGVLISNYATHSQTNASEAVWALTSLAVTTFVAIANFIGHKKFTYR